MPSGSKRIEVQRTTAATSRFRLSQLLFDRCIQRHGPLSQRQAACCEPLSLQPDSFFARLQVMCNYGINMVFLESIELAHYLRKANLDLLQLPPR
jgi:hypothetical protein